jgi:acyl-CoA hydrolase
MEVWVQIDAEDLNTGERRQAMMAHYIMVATNDKGKPVGVPPLIVITEEEERLFNEGLARYETVKKQSGK